jgi:uncharacterized ion transporter superfamily protein YfcC
MEMKKGFFFSIDAFFALILFVLIIMAIYTFFINVGSLRQQYYFSEDLFNVMNNVKIRELDETSYTEMVNLAELNDNMTIMEQIVTYQLNDSCVECIDDAKLLAGMIIGGLIDKQYGASLDIQGNRLWPSSTPESGTNIVVRQRISSGQVQIE